MLLILNKIYGALVCGVVCNMGFNTLLKRVAMGICLLCCFLFCSCNKSSKKISIEADHFIELEKEGLVKRHGYEFIYNDQECQHVYNKKRKYMRLQRDDMSAYINVTSQELFAGVPSVGDFVDIELAYSTSASVEENRKSYSMLVLQVKAKCVWMWNEEEKLGLILNL